MVWAAILGSFALYVVTLCPTITAQDSGELIVGPATLSIVHPPGYPLYMALGHLLASVIPLGPMALRINLFSAVCTSLAIGWLAWLLMIEGAYPAGRAPPARTSTIIRSWPTPMLAAGAAGLAALIPQLWGQAIVAEVYALNLVILASFVWILTRWESGRHPRWCWLGSVILGAGLANHHTLLLIVPFLAFLIWGSFRGSQPSHMDSLHIVCAATLLLGLGLALYLALMLRSLANPPMDWGNPESWRALFAHALRKQYRPLGGQSRTLALLFEQFGMLGTFFPISGTGLVSSRRAAGYDGSSCAAPAPSRSRPSPLSSAPALSCSRISNPSPSKSTR